MPNVPKTFRNKELPHAVLMSGERSANTTSDGLRGTNVAVAAVRGCHKDGTVDTEERAGPAGAGADVTDAQGVVGRCEDAVCRDLERVLGVGRADERYRHGGGLSGGDGVGAAGLAQGAEHREGGEETVCEGDHVCWCCQRLKRSFLKQEMRCVGLKLCWRFELVLCCLDEMRLLNVECLPVPWSMFDDYIHTYIHIGHMNV